MRGLVAPAKWRLILDDASDADAVRLYREGVIGTIDGRRLEHHLATAIGLAVWSARRFGVGQVRDGDFHARALYVEGTRAGVDGVEEGGHDQRPSLMA